MQLTRPDSEALAQLDARFRLIRDRVIAVARGFSFGLYVYGAGGVGKSYSVLEQLAELEVAFRVFNSRLTAKGLFHAMHAAPDAIHVLEDVERVTGDKDAQALLRAALWPQPGRERVVNWTTGDGEMRFEFRGGIIMLANRPLADLPELRALATRIAVHKLDVTDAEMVAHLRRIAGSPFKRGRHKLDVEHCCRVCEFMIYECRAAGCPLDLRLYENCCLDYLQWDCAQAACDWHDLIATRIRQSVAHFKHETSPLTREQQLVGHRQLIRQIDRETDDPRERVRLWQERTGRSAATYYRRKQEADSHQFDEEITGQGNR